MVPSATQTSQVVWRKLSRFMSRAYRVDVDESALKNLRKLNDDASLIFLPNHKSYLDPVILRSTLAKQGFPGNYVLGGDNLAFWPMAPLARRNGIVFIRREFKAPTSTSARCAPTSPSCWRRRPTWSGTSRVGVRAPASCARRGSASSRLRRGRLHRCG